MGFHSFGKTIKQAKTDVFSADSSHIHFSIWSPNVDTSSYPQSKEKIDFFFLNGIHASIVLPNLNLPKKNINMDSGNSSQNLRHLAFFGVIAPYSDREWCNCRILLVKNWSLIF